MEPDLERLIGQLESKVDALTYSITQLLESNKDLTARIDDSTRRLHKRINALSRKVTIHTTAIQVLEDRTDGQGRAVQELENLAEQSKGRIQNNRRWVKVLVTIAGGAELWHNLGDKIVKALHGK